MTAAPLTFPAATQPLSYHLRRTLQLAAPIVVARAAVLLMTVVDSAMTGWAGSEELAALGLGVAPQLTLMMIAIGFLQATPILTAQAIGAGEAMKAGAALRSGLLHALVLGFLGIGLSLAGGWFFRLTGQPEEVVEVAAKVTLIFALGLPGMLLFVTVNMFLEATGRAKTGMWVLIVAGLIDLPLNGVFALGWGGFVEPMGAVGAVGTSSVLRSLGFLATLAILLHWEKQLGDPRGVLRALSAWHFSGGSGGRMRRIGVPIGLAQGVESAAFSAMVFLGGLISTDALAAHQATISVTALVYMIAVGIGSATAIRVGNAIGRGASADVRLAGWSGIILAGLAALPFALLFRFAPELVAGIYGLRGTALAVTVATVAVAGYVLVLDAMMGASLGALRGAGDVWTAFAIQSGAFWLSAVPLSAWLGIAMGLGAPGLIYGILSGVAISFVLLAWRFSIISHGPIARI